MTSSVTYFFAKNLTLGGWVVKYFDLSLSDRLSFQSELSVLNHPFDTKDAALFVKNENIYVTAPLSTVLGLQFSSKFFKNLIIDIGTMRMKL